MRVPLNALYRYALVALYAWGFIGFPLSTFVSEFSGAEDNLVSILSRAIFVVIGLITVGLAVSTRNYFVGRGRWVLSYLLFWVLYSIRLVHDCLSDPHLLGRPVADYLLFGLVICFAGSFSFFSFPDDQSLRRAYFAYLGALVLFNLLSLYTNLITNDIGEVVEGGYIRLPANERLNPISYGVLGVSLALQALNQLQTGRVGLSGRVLLVGLIGLGITNLLLSGSRSPAIGLVVGVLLLALNQLRSRQFAGLLLLAGLVAMGWGWVLTQAPELLTNLADRFAGINEGETSSALRLESYRGAWAQFLNHPFTGDFIEERSAKEYPHNPILESLMSLGLAGGLLYLAIFLPIAARAMRLATQPRYTWAALLYVQAAITAFVSGGLGFNYDYWYTTVVVFVLSSKTRPAATDSMQKT